MTALFADLPEATRNTVEIAMRAAFWPQSPEADPAALRRRRRGDRRSPTLPRRQLLREAAREGLDRTSRGRTASRRAGTEADYASASSSSSASSSG